MVGLGYRAKEGLKMLLRNKGGEYECKTGMIAQAGFYGGNCSSVSFLGPGTCDASCGRCSICPAQRGPPTCQVNVEVSHPHPAGLTILLQDRESLSIPSGTSPRLRKGIPFQVGEK